MNLAETRAKLIVGVPHNPDFHPEYDGWKRLKEPGTKTAIVIGHLASVLLGSLVYLAASTWSGFSLDQFIIDLWSIPAFIALIAVHERLHALFHPGWGSSPHTRYGVLPKALVFYAHYDAVVTRSRLMAILAAPFVGLTVIPLLIALLWPATAQAACAIAVLNALFSALDLFNTALVFFRVPAGAEIRNQGWQSYWRPARDAR